MKQVRNFWLSCNPPQRRVLIVAVAIMLLMWLFPPVEIDNGLYSSPRYVRGYGFLFDLEHAEVLVGRLITQWLAVGVVATMLHFLLRKGGD